MSCPNLQAPLWCFVAIVEPEVVLQLSRRHKCCRRRTEVADIGACHRRIEAVSIAVVEVAAAVGRTANATIGATLLLWLDLVVFRCVCIYIFNLRFESKILDF